MYNRTTQHGSHLTTPTPTSPPIGPTMYFPPVWFTVDITVPHYMYVSLVYVPQPPFVDAAPFYFIFLLRRFAGRGCR